MTITLSPRMLAFLRKKTEGYIWPVPILPGGFTPRISDGFAHRGDKTKRNGLGHRGVDIMWRRRHPLATPNHPFGSRWYWVPEDEQSRPVLACGPGVVVYAGPHREGGKPVGNRVVIDHGDGFGTAYHHLQVCLVAPGDPVNTDQVIGIMGGSPTGYGLIHLHFDCAMGGRFFDGEKLLRHWNMVGLRADHRLSNLL